MKSKGHETKTAAARLAKEDGVSLNQFIAVAVAEKVGTIETAEQFLKRRAAKAKPATSKAKTRSKKKSVAKAKPKQTKKAKRKAKKGKPRR